jgi:hypothetical protein
MKTAFIDFEASSLGEHGYPIEVAWVSENGDCESYLILPEVHWTDWDDVSAQVHGISRADLAADGVSAADVARRLAEALKGCTLYSDAAATDGCWLTRLLGTAALDPLSVADVAEIYIDACCPLTVRMTTMIAAPLVQRILRQADAEAKEAFPRAHRAADDASRLWFTWRRLGEIVAGVIDGGPA